MIYRTRIVACAAALIVAAGCTESAPSESDVSDVGNARLGIARFVTDELENRTSVRGLDVDGREVAHLDLVHGEFALSPAFASDYDTANVDGRKLELYAGGQKMSFEVAGYEPLMQMPAHPASQWKLAVFSDDPHVRAVLDRWQLGFRTSDVGDAEVSYELQGAQEVGYAYSWCGTTSCGSVRGLTINMCAGSGAESGIKTSRSTAMFGGNEDVDVVHQCCSNDGVNFLVSSFAFKMCPRNATNLNTDCGAVTSTTACKGCGSYDASGTCYQGSPYWSSSYPWPTGNGTGAYVVTSYWDADTGE